MENLLEKIINKWFIGLGESGLEGAWKWLEAFALSPTKLRGNYIVNDLHDIVLVLSVGIAVLLLVYNLAKKQVSDLGGFSGRSTAEILVKSIGGMVFAYCTPFIIYNVELAIANAASKLILGKGINIDIVKKAFSLDDGIMSRAEGSSALSITIFCLLASLVVYMFQYIKRDGEMIVLFILAPFAATTMVNEEMNIFPVWFREVTAIVFMQPLQLMILYLVINIISDAKGLEDMYMAFGLMLVLIFSPSWLRKFLYSTGTGKTMINAAGNASKAAMFRLMMRR